MKKVLSAILMTLIWVPISHAIAGSLFSLNEQSFPTLLKLFDEHGAEALYGSGFYFADLTNIYLVTARHVLYSETAPYHLLEQKGSVSAFPVEEDKDSYTFDLDFLTLSNAGCMFVSSNHDIAAIHMWYQVSSTQIHLQPGVSGLTGTNMTMMALGGDAVGGYTNVTVGQDTYVFGYPVSLGIREAPKIDYNRPLLRKGIVAQKNAAARTIIIDAPAYGGNSGGPVFVVEKDSPLAVRMRIVGVVTEFIPYYDIWRSQRLKIDHVEVYNSGYSVVEPMETVRELLHH
jgi:hypothetical protein